jgi:predicted dehydrogenase
MVPMGEKQTLRHYAYVGTADLVETVLPDTPPTWEDTLVFPIRDLTAAILENRAPASQLADNLRIYGLLDALYASAKSRQAVTVRT